MRGYKAFYQDFTCREFKFHVGGEYESASLQICKSGFHFCREPAFIINYYDWYLHSNFRFAEIEATGDIVDDGRDKYATNRIRIVREISRAEFMKLCTGKFTDMSGNQYWYRDGRLHRKDGPAAEHSNGTRRWYLNRILHREDGPAVEYPNGTRYWYYVGQLHRMDGPAVIEQDGTEKWYQNGVCHREDGPAVTYPDGTKYWIRHGIDIGDPAIEKAL